MKHIRYVLLALLVCQASSVLAKYNQLVNVLHHKGKSSGNSVPAAHSADAMGSMELGNVVFYFAKKPRVSLLPIRDYGAKNVEKITQVFIFPYAEIRNNSIVKQINGKHTDAYALKIEKIDTPVKGIRFSFTYNPQKVSFNYAFFDAISNYKGVVFNFYNKNLLDKLNDNSDAVLRTVSNRKQKMRRSKKKTIKLLCLIADKEEETWEPLGQVA